jgi:pimeloyl-ACP methyl ester carboxylesterase
MPKVERFATVVHIDPVGTGESDPLPGGDCSMTDRAHLSASSIGAPGGEETFFLGHSHGGTVALQLALDHPQVLRGVVVGSGRASTAGLVESATEQVEAFVRCYRGTWSPCRPAPTQDRRPRGGLRGRYDVVCGPGSAAEIRQDVPGAVGGFRRQRSPRAPGGTGLLR